MERIRRHREVRGPRGERQGVGQGELHGLGVIESDVSSAKAGGEVDDGSDRAGREVRLVRRSTIGRGARASEAEAFRARVTRQNLLD